MEYTSAACPNCGANIKIDSSMEKGFCTYCGSQVILKENDSDSLKFKKLLKLIRKEIKNNRHTTDEFRELLNDALRLCPDSKEVYELQMFEIWNSIIEDHKLIKHTSNKDKLVVPSFIYTIKSGAFVSCNKLTDITIKKSVTLMGVGVFANRRNTLVIHADACTCAAKYAVANYIRLDILKENNYWPDIEKTCRRIRAIQNKIIECKLDGVEKIKSHYSSLYPELNRGSVNKQKHGCFTLIAIVITIVMIVYLIQNNLLEFFIFFGLLVFLCIMSHKYGKCSKNIISQSDVVSGNYADIYDWNNAFNSSFIYHYIQNNNHSGFRIWNCSNTQIRSEYTYLKSTLQELEKLDPNRFRRFKSINDTHEVNYNLSPVVTAENKLAENYLNLAMYNYNEINNSKRDYLIVYDTEGYANPNEINTFTMQQTLTHNGILRIYDEMLMAKEGVFYTEDNYSSSNKLDMDMYFMTKKCHVRQCGSRAEVFLTLAQFMPILGKNLITTYNTKQYDMETFLQFM